MNLIEQALSHWIDRQRDLGSPQSLVDASEYALRSGGKRIRPRLMLAAAQALDVSIERVLPLALALELYHTFSLIHDDLPGLDNDDERRGKPTVHRIFGEAQAILAGDFLLHESLTIIYSIPHAEKMQALFRDCTGAKGVIGGQSMEFEHAANSRSHSQTTINNLKTAALFRFSVAAPALLNPSLSEALGVKLLQFGTDLGLAFQFADDCEDNARLELYSKTSKERFIESLEAWEKTFNDPIWIGDTTELRAACREVVNKLRSA